MNDKILTILLLFSFIWPFCIPTVVNIVQNNFGVGDGNVYSLGIMDQDTNEFLIDLNFQSSNPNIGTRTNLDISLFSITSNCFRTRLTVAGGLADENTVVWRPLGGAGCRPKSLMFGTNAIPWDFNVTGKILFPFTGDQNLNAIDSNGDGLIFRDVNNTKGISLTGILAKVQAGSSIQDTTLDSNQEALNSFLRKDMNYSGKLDLNNAVRIGDLNIDKNSSFNDRIVQIQTKTYSNSTSVGGGLFINSTSNLGASMIIYNNAGSTATGRLLNVRADNNAFPQAAVHIDYDGTANALEVVMGDTNDSSAQAFNVVSNNELDSAFGINARTLSKGTAKITHLGDGRDASASVLSLAIDGNNTAAQGIFIDSNVGTIGKILNLRNSGIELLTFTFDGLTGFRRINPSFAIDVNGDVNANRLCINGDCRSSWPTGGSTTDTTLDSNQEALEHFLTKDLNFSGKVDFNNATLGATRIADLNVYGNAMITNSDINFVKASGLNATFGSTLGFRYFLNNNPSVSFILDLGGNGSDDNIIRWYPGAAVESLTAIQVGTGSRPLDFNVMRLYIDRNQIFIDSNSQGMRFVDCSGANCTGTTNSITLSNLMPYATRDKNTNVIDENVWNLGSMMMIGTKAAATSGTTFAVNTGKILGVRMLCLHVIDGTGTDIGCASVVASGDVWVQLS